MCLHRYLSVSNSDFPFMRLTSAKLLVYMLETFLSECGHSIAGDSIHTGAWTLINCQTRLSSLKGRITSCSPASKTRSAKLFVADMLSTPIQGYVNNLSCRHCSE